MKIQKEDFLNSINKALNIYIMGHIDLDLDSLGSAIGLVKIVEKYGKKGFIILNDEINEPAVAQAIVKVKDEITLIHGSKVEITDNDLLIIVDTSKKSLVQDASLLEKIPNQIVIDHHSQSEETIFSDYKYIDESASSTCEMIVELLVSLNIILSPEINTYILAGIVLDTNNFVVKTDEKTYYSAYQLCLNGANPTKVQYLLKQDLSDYIARQKVITNVKVYDHIAITRGEPDLKYRREDLAKIADTLLQFKAIEASFVIGVTGKNTVGISARSMGNFPVSKIMEKLGGGGDSHDAATRIEGKTVEEVETELLSLIR